MKNEILDKILKGNKNLIVEGGLSSGKTTNVLFPLVDELIEKKGKYYQLYTGKIVNA